MNRRTLTTTAVLGATLVLGVPTAWGSGEPYRDHGDATEARLVLQSSPVDIVRDHGDATDAKMKFALQPAPLVIVRDHGDATQAKLALQSAPFVARETAMKASLQSSSLGIVRDHGDATRAKLVAQSSPEPLSAETSGPSGRELDWSQLGIGVLIGTVFAFGLILAVRFTRSRPLAH